MKEIGAIYLAHQAKYQMGKEPGISEQLAKKMALINRSADCTVVSRYLLCLDMGEVEHPQE